MSRFNQESDFQTINNFFLVILHESPTWKPETDDLVEVRGGHSGVL